jgi:hypothetical protein
MPYSSSSSNRLVQSIASRGRVASVEELVLVLLGQLTEVALVHPTSRIARTPAGTVEGWIVWVVIPRSGRERLRARMRGMGSKGLLL